MIWAVFRGFTAKFFAEADHNITGVDISKRSIESAKEIGLDIIYINKNYLDIIFKALKPGEIFIFDTMNEKTAEIIKDGEKNWEVTDAGFWKDNPYLALSEIFHFLKNKVFLNQTIVFSEPEDYRTYRFWTHCYDYSDLKPILEKAGFKGIQSYEIF